MKNVVVPYLAPIVKYLEISLLARSRSSLKFTSKPGVYYVAHGSKGKNEHKQASVRVAPGQGTLGTMGTEAFDHLYFFINAAMLTVQLHLCGGLSVACRLVPLGSCVVTAGTRGQNHITSISPFGAMARSFSSKEMMDL